MGRKSNCNERIQCPSVAVSSRRSGAARPGASADVVTALSQLVGWERLNLDDSISHPSTRLFDAGPDVSTSVTIHDCSTHSCGWEAGFFENAGCDDDALAAMVTLMDKLVRMTPRTGASPARARTAGSLRDGHSEIRWRASTAGPSYAQKPSAEIEIELRELGNGGNGL